MNIIDQEIRHFLIRRIVKVWSNHMWMKQNPFFFTSYVLLVECSMYRCQKVSGVIWRECAPFEAFHSTDFTSNRQPSLMWNPIIWANGFTACSLLYILSGIVSLAARFSFLSQIQRLAFSLVAWITFRLALTFLCLNPMNRSPISASTHLSTFCIKPQQWKMMNLKRGLQTKVRLAYHKLLSIQRKIDI